MRFVQRFVQLMRMLPKSVWMRRATVRGAALIAFGAMIFAAPHAASAQRREHVRERVQERQARKQDEKQKGKGHGKADGKTPRRAALEKAYRAQTESVVRRRLNLNDDQMTKLRGVNSRLGTRRRDLVQQERETNQALRTEVARGKGADQKRVTQLMNQAQELQQQRMQLQTQERKEVSQFLSPVQQAQYFGLQARLRQRARELEKGGGQ